MIFHNHLLYAIGMPGGSEMLIILLIVVILFGSSKLPMLGDALGKSIQNFRKSFKGDENDQAEVLEATIVDNQDNTHTKEAHAKDAHTKDDQARIEDR
jgi:sec-independent protein translocase protein TatA